MTGNAAEETCGSCGEWKALLRRAAELAARGAGRVEPNPRVGALALEEGKIVGMGWHERYGGPHAEEAALEDARNKGGRPDTLVVTLEPCASEGMEKKRHPCTSLLVAAGIRRVILGEIDPDPRHQGAGIRILREKEVEVLGPFPQDETRNLLERFRIALSLDRPWIHGKWAMTLDGKAATREGVSKWITGPEARREAHRLRAAVDAVAVGIGTVLRDDPLLTVREVPGRTPLRIVFDSDLRTPGTSSLIRSLDRGSVLLVHGEGLDSGRGKVLEDLGAELLAVPPAEDGRPRLDLACRALRSRGIRSLLVEGGPRLLGAFMDRAFLDQVTAFQAPILFGGGKAPGPMGGTGVRTPAEAVPLEEIRVRRFGADLAITGFTKTPSLEGGTEA